MNYLSVDDLTAERMGEIFDIADDLGKGKSRLKLKEHAILALLFEKPSTRTRISFESAIIQLGGEAIYVDSRTSQLSRGESLSDTARVLSMYVDFIAARMYKHGDVVELAAGASVPVINALTDLEHPVQALGDVYTIMEVKGKVKGLKIAFVGDIAANTANSLMLAGAKLGARISLVGPKSYEPNEVYVEKARKYSEVNVYNSLQEGLLDADVIYTDTFVSMGQEAEADVRKKLFQQYQVNSDALNYAKPDCSVMHCLPAHREEEITSDVLDGPRSIAWKQAGNKLVIEKAMLLYLSKPR